jgi:hypothetical protein
MVLSEGGGIRAAYWSAKLLAYLQSANTNFSKYVFGIYGVSGGSFGASIFTSLLKYSETLPAEKTGHFIERLSGNIIGKDFLSPLIASMFTEEILQYIIPFPISGFDHAKVFEKTWEYHWSNEVQKEGQKNTNSAAFDGPFLSLWKDNRDYHIPALFLGVTQVENGYPYLICNISFTNTGISNKPGEPGLGLIHDVYYYTAVKDLRISTASLLSARFPYVGPAGILSKNSQTAGFVDGGYFDNTGANAAYQILTAIADKIENGADDPAAAKFKAKVLPIVIYLRNNPDTPETHDSGRAALYQLTAPIKAIFQVQSSHTANAVQRLKSYISMNSGYFIDVPLDSAGINDNDSLEVPMGWALSRAVQEQIDRQVTNTAEQKCRIILDMLPK